MNKQDKKEIMNLIKYKKMLGGRRMNLEKAIKVLKEWIRIDRMTRGGEEHSDYDDFCEEKCIAIDTVLTALDERYNKGYQDGFKQAKFDCEMDKLDGR